MMSNSIMSFIIAAVMMFTAIPAGAQVDFMFDPVYNYTEDCTFKMTFDSSKEFVALLKELEMPEEFEAFANVEKLLETLFSAEGKVFVQADIGEDMKKAQLAITADEFNAIDFNKNLQISVASKMGIWMVYDFTDMENPVYEIVYSLPFMEKYVHIDLMKIMPKEEIQAFTAAFAESLEKTKTDETKAFMMGLLEEHADISVSLTKATIKLDNDGLIAMIKDTIPYIVTLVEPYMPESGKEAMAELVEAISLDGLKLLGEEGIVYTYNFKNGRISTASTDMDISIDISKIYTAITGEEWQFVSSGKLDFSVETDMVVSKIGSTKVEIPNLTDENSISLSDMIEEGITVSPYEEYEPHYPNWWVYGEVENIPVINGEIYVPLNAVLEAAYEASVTITSENGTVTAASDYFPGFKTMTVTVNSDKIYLDGVEKTTSTVISENDNVYVSSKLFEEIFGWELTDADYYMLDNSYWYEFDTNPWAEEEELTDGAAQPLYPNWWVGGETENIPVINGEIYVPLRMTLELGYEDSVQIGFDNGVITAASDYFPGFKTMVLTNGSDKVYLDGAEKTTSAVVIENGTTYVSHKLFTEVFGWSFDDASYYMVQDYYYYSFATQPDYE